MDNHIINMNAINPVNISYDKLSYIIYLPQFFIGQIEGGFVFSLGFWMQEQIKHDPTTGQLLTNDTWVS